MKMTTIWMSNDSTADGDDIVPACYVLDIDIRVVEDMIYRFVPIMSERSNLPRNSTLKITHCPPNPMSPRVMTGQPGIGEFC
jgi:hypothetical protein